MAELTAERIAQLLELYSNLKKRVLTIDEKYSLDYIPPQIELPESLNLIKLEYNPKTDEELHELAELEVQASLIAKQRSIDNDYTKTIKQLAADRSKLHERYSQKLAQMTVEYREECDTIRRKVINNGLLFSTVLTKYLNKALNDYTQRTEKNAENEFAESAIIDQEELDAENIFQASCDSLEVEKQAMLENAYQKLVEAEEKLKRDVETYNNRLEEKEQNYRASRERTLLSARNAEFYRAREATKIFEEMGEVGFRALISREKYAICKEEFTPLRKNEAQFLLEVDSFLIAHLGVYYSSFTDWVDTSLIP